MSGKAEVAVQKLQKGNKKNIRKIRKMKKFTAPQTTQTPSKPLYEHYAVKPVAQKRNDYKIIRGPVTSDKATRKLEDENTMTFWVDIRATKPEIKAAFNRLYHVMPEKVNTMITPKMLKKAYIRIPEGTEAMNLANEIGFA